MSEIFAKVILPLALPSSFTYAVPDVFLPLDQCGIRVVVPFGKSKFYTGVICEYTDKKPDTYDVKPIFEVLDSKPVITDYQFKLWQWIADYYLCCTGEVFRVAVPSALKPESETVIRLTDKEFDSSSLKPNELKIVLALKNKHFLSVSQLQKITGLKNNIGLVKKLSYDGLITVNDETQEIYKPKTEKYLTLSSDMLQDNKIKEIFDSLDKRAPKQVGALLYYLSVSGARIAVNTVSMPGEIKKKEFLKNPEMSASALSSLIEKGVLTEYEKEISRISSYEGQLRDAHELTPAQNIALNDIKTCFEKFNTVLFYGVTGSGKTEIFISLIRQQLDAGRRVLYLVPEIVLSSHIIGRLKAVFGDDAAIWHSKISDSERVEIWKNIADADNEKSFKLIVGVRSSIFLPFSNLGLIIVDEEHEQAYKQFDPAPRYNARDCTVVTGGIYSAKVLLASATPSVESYFNALNGKYGYVELSERYSKAPKPQIIISDIKEAVKKKQMKSLFTPQSANEIKFNLEHSKQTLVFRNRRGFSPYVECKTCGWVPMCENCDVSLTYHKRENRLICHHCGYAIDMPQNCKACGDSALQTRGFGTEKAEDEIRILFPGSRVARLDADTSRSKVRFESILEDFDNGDIDILTGTRMISQGFDFQRLTSALILDADSMLNFPDFRAEERAFQLIMQIAGRTGRCNESGRVIIQTADPQREIFQDVLRGDFKAFYRRIVAERTGFQYPPYSKVVIIKLKHADMYVLDKASEVLASILKQTFAAGVLGPEYPTVSKVRSYYVKQIVLKISRKYYGTQAKQRILEAINYTKSTALKSGLIIQPDVDPV